jgi:hypothetical protein
MRVATWSVRRGVMAMTDTAWLVVAVAAGVSIAATWVSRELTIHRRRQERSTGEERRE